MSRIHYLNKLSTAIGRVKLERAVELFLFQDKNIEFRYQIYYRENDGRAPEAVIKVFKEDADTPSGPWIIMGEYNAVEWKRFQADISRSTIGNPTGAVELANNLLYNGLFNAMGNPLDGWIIETDSTSGTAYMTGEGNRMKFGSDGTGSMVIRNTKTTLVNLTSYVISIRIHAVTGVGEFELQIGGQVGVTYNATGVFNETIIGGGADFDISINLTNPDTEFIVDYIIVNGN